jgi:hypothetical protein
MTNIQLQRRSWLIKLIGCLKSLRNQSKNIIAKTPVKSWRNKSLISTTPSLPISEKLTKTKSSLKRICMGLFRSFVSSWSFYTANCQIIRMTNKGYRMNSWRNLMYLKWLKGLKIWLKSSYTTFRTSQIVSQDSSTYQRINLCSLQCRLWDTQFSIANPITVSMKT